MELLKSKDGFFYGLTIDNFIDDDNACGFCSIVNFYECSNNLIIYQHIQLLPW